MAYHCFYPLYHIGCGTLCSVIAASTSLETIVYIQQIFEKQSLSQKQTSVQAMQHHFDFGTLGLRLRSQTQDGERDQSLSHVR